MRTVIPAALNNVLERHPEINTIALHLDTDYAGRSAAKAITEQLRDKYIIRDEPPCTGKDCNDLLIQIMKQCRSRHMNSARYGKRCFCFEAAGRTRKSREGAAARAGKGKSRKSK